MIARVAMVERSHLAVAISLALGVSLAPGGSAHAETVAPGEFTCAQGSSPADAFAAAAKQRPIRLSITANGFVFSGGLVRLAGPLARPDASRAEAVKAAVASTLTRPAIVLLDADDDRGFATAAIGVDAAGNRAALIATRNGKFFFACQGPKATGADQQIAAGDGAAGDPSVKAAAPPEQRGKEASLIGSLAAAPPRPGRYACQTINIRYDGTSTTTKTIGNLDADGFDLYADGSYRVTGKKAKSSLAEGLWRSGPAPGAFAFGKGSLSIYLKAPIHARSKTIGDVLYEADYDSDGDLDELIVCGFGGPPQGLSPKQAIAALGAKNSAPPPPGKERISGLYYKIDWIMMTGPNFTMYQEPVYRFRYFQDNGYVWLADPPEDGDFDKLSCSKPMVDEEGEASCTTYTIEAGKIRIGLEKPVAFSKDDGGIELDGSTYIPIAPMRDLRLDRRYRYFTYNGVAAISKGISFTRDGAFTSDSSVGISYTTPEIGDTQTTVTGYNENEPTIGRYKLDGYSLTITKADGSTIKRFFGLLSEGMFYLNGDAYLDR
jgi:hypothetical protein